MGHVCIAGVQRLRRETRLERSRVARCHGTVAGPAGPGPEIGHGPAATGQRAAGAVKRNIPGSGINRLASARFRDKGRERRGDRECHCVGRSGGTLIIRHPQREDMGHVCIAGVQRLRRETRLERSRVARCHGTVAGPAGPGPEIGHGPAATGQRAAGAVKRNIPGSGINRLASARFRDKGRERRGDRECHCVGRSGGTLIIRHPQREDMGHVCIAGVQRLRRETRLERSRVARCHGTVAGPAGPGPEIGHGPAATGQRAAGAVKRNIPGSGINRLASARFRDKGRERRGDRECHCVGRSGGTLIIRHPQREDMGHVCIAGVQRLRRETRLERSRVARCHGTVAGPAGPGPEIGHGPAATGQRAAGAVKRNIPGSGINRLASARFRDKGRERRGDRECHCVGRSGGTLIIRHPQREDMGHVCIAGVQRLRRETRLERSRVARCHGTVAGPAGPGPEIGHGPAATGQRAAGAVKRNIPGSGINRLASARFRDKGRERRGDRECHCVGRSGGTLIIRHPQREDMGHVCIAGVQRLRRETRLERSRVARCHGTVAGPAGPGPEIGHGPAATGQRAAGAVKRNIPGSGINRLASARFRDKGRERRGDRECHCVGRSGGTLIIRHPQREDMGHVCIAGVQRLRRETRLERSRVARCHGTVAGPAGPGPEIGHGPAATGQRAAGAVKRNIPGSGINRLASARFRDKGRERRGDRECHCVGRSGGTLIIRHPQREDMGHVCIAGVQRLRRETRLERSRVARCHGTVAGPAGPGPEIGHGPAATGQRAAGAVKRNIPGSGINRLASARFRDKGRERRGDRECPDEFHGGDAEPRRCRRDPYLHVEGDG